MGTPNTADNNVTDIDQAYLVSGRGISLDVAIRILESREKLVSFDDALKIVRGLNMENGIQLIQHIIGSKEISTGRKSIFFQAMQIETYQDLSILSTYSIMAIYFGLQNDEGNSNIAISTAAMLRQTSRNPIDHNELARILSELGQDPWKITGNERVIIKTKFLGAIAPFKSKKVVNS